MIIKFFGKGGNDEDDGEGKDDGKINYINLIEPLITILSRSKENGSKLTGLSVMAIVNMCNFVDDFKDIFIQKNGQSIIMELLRSKDENIMINNLKLIMTLINQTGSESNLGRQIGEANDNEIIYQLVKLIKFGPNIKHCFFSK